MYKIPQNTLFVGKSLVYVPHCQSTNALAAELAQRIETPDGTVVITDHQTAGRGQRGNKWETRPGENLTFSVILQPGFLAVKDQFQLNEAISIGIADYITGKGIEKVLIKWPNDILVNGKKVGGILIENHISGDEILYSIVGIGLNFNQQVFEYPQAGSLSGFSNEEYNLSDELVLLLCAIEARYLELKSGNRKSVESTYLGMLYQRGEVHRFSAHGETFEGVITGVNDAGQLTITAGKERRYFGVKEVIFL